MNTTMVAANQFAAWEEGMLPVATVGASLSLFWSGGAVCQADELKLGRRTGVVFHSSFDGPTHPVIAKRQNQKQQRDANQPASAAFPNQKDAGHKQ